MCYVFKRKEKYDFWELEKKNNIHTILPLEMVKFTTEV